jgi:hypothetical protein
MRIQIERNHLLDCGIYPVFVELTADNAPVQTFLAHQIVGADVMAFSMFVDSEEYRKAVMTELKRRMPNLNSVQKKKDGKVYAISRTYQSQHIVDYLMVITADPAPHRESYLFYP